MAHLYQKRSDTRQNLRIEADLRSPKEQGPVRHVQPAGVSYQSDARIGEIEQKISTLTTALADQQHIISRFQSENDLYATQVNDLKKKLHELHKEYDLILSENFSLKAKIKKMTAGQPAGSPAPMSGETSHFNVLPPEMEKMNKKDRADLHKRLFEDTRLMKAIDINDTSEIDIEDLK